MLASAKIVKGEVCWFPENCFLSVDVIFLLIAVADVIDRLLFDHWEQLLCDATDLKGGLLLPTQSCFMELMMVNVCTQTRTAHIGDDDWMAARVT
jgi:hypothetical protein